MMPDRTIQQDDPIIVPLQPICRKWYQRLRIQGDHWSLVGSQLRSVLRTPIDSHTAISVVSMNNHGKCPLILFKETLPHSPPSSPPDPIHLFASCTIDSFYAEKLAPKTTRVRWERDWSCFLSSCATQKPELPDFVLFMPLLTPITENGRRNDYPLSWLDSV